MDQKYILDFIEATNRLIGKTDRKNKKVGLLAIHLLDTAMIGDYYYRYWMSKRIKGQIRQGCKDERTTSNMIELALLMHDFGKLTYGFQQNIYDNAGIDYPIILKDDLSPLSEHYSHADILQALLLNSGFPKSFISLLASHHGETFELSPIRVDKRKWINGNKEGEWTKLRETVIKAALNLTGFSSTNDIPELDSTIILLLSGFLSEMDWKASNTNLFPLVDSDELDSWIKRGILISKLEKRRNNAIKKLNPAWLDNQEKMESYKEENNSNEWIDSYYLDRFGFLPREIQRVIAQITWEINDPGLILLEAPMGVGKTEAALCSAEIFEKRSIAEGIYFALPTQASTNQIFERVLVWLNSQKRDSKVELAHSNAWLNPEYQSVLQGEVERVKADKSILNIKEELFAQNIVGTIDRILKMSVKHKYVSLRHAGIAQKAVIIDEVHACDEFMLVYLKNALEWLGNYHVPVILLSATLSKECRLSLFHSYLKGKYRTDLTNISFKAGYPLLTWSDGQEVFSKCDLNPAGEKEIDLQKYSYDIKDALDEGLFEKLKSNTGCTGIIMATVDGAIQMA
ncbi:MAG: CRISPR-associated endonuclease Cas3'', partial [Erysipelotrichaceae bacterium]|nr:CRISPR-associated endonuclease Cas3'' [Erysipelotrichaceae bacterium]